MRFTSVVAAALATVFGEGLPLLAQPSTDSPDGLWQDPPVAQRAPAATDAWNGVLSYRRVQLNQTALEQALSKAPSEAGVRPRASQSVIALPMPDGSYQIFRYVESPIMAPELAAKYPGIRTYLGQGIDDPHATVRFDWTPAGFHAFILSPSGTVLIDPYVEGQTDQYVSFYRRDVSPEAAAWTCLTDNSTEPVEGLPGSQAGPLGSGSGGTLRTYRLAMAATAEYTASKGGVTQTAASIATIVNRLTGVFEQEFTIRLQLVANNNLLIYTNAATDPYTNGDLDAMLGQNQTNLDSVIGSANYDMGHVIGTQASGASGLSYIGVVCDGARKAKAGSASAPWNEESFTMRIVVHEMGHQFGSHHTWNGTGCPADQWGSSSACEPGSGSTIMSYAGSCGTDNIQSSNDDYFHAISYEKIRAYCSTGTGGTCGTTSATGNTVPSISVPGPRTIPKMTPFTLTATGSR